jgi:carboxyl-terminal processing protease
MKDPNQKSFWLNVPLLKSPDVRLGAVLLLFSMILLFRGFNSHSSTAESAQSHASSVSAKANTGSATNPLSSSAAVNSDGRYSPVVDDAALFAGCGPDNHGAFDGPFLYRCVFNYARKRELSLLDADAAQAFTRFEHKHDHDGMLDREQSTKIAIVEMLASLKQPHTKFLDVRDYQELRNHMDATLSGVGAYVMQKGVNSKLTALGSDPTKVQLREAQLITSATAIYFWPAPLAGGPADKAGVQIGDRILKVGDQDVEGRTLFEVSQSLLGESGTQVSVVVERKSSGRTSELTLHITRAAVAVPMVETEDLDADAPGTIASVKIRGFVSKDLPITVAQSIYKLCTGVELARTAGGGIEFGNYNPKTDCKLKGLVLDFRNDGGGRVDFATMIPQLLIDHGPLVSTFERRGDHIVETKLVLELNTVVTETFVDGELKSAKGADRFMSLLPPDLPIAVLINDHSASASEMLAGLLQRHGATVVGTPSYGKEVGQELIPLAFGTAFKTTILKFKPGDEELGAAIMPNVEIEQSPEYLDDPMSARDQQMQKAVEVVHGLIAETAQNANRAAMLRQKHSARDARSLQSFN